MTTGGLGFEPDPLAYGETLRRARRRGEARTHLREALATFERLGAAPWTDRDKAELPAQFPSRVLSVTYAVRVVGMAILVYGLVELDLLAVVSGLLITQTAKAWLIDRMALLYEDMKARDPSYAGWER